MISARVKISTYVDQISGLFEPSTEEEKDTAKAEKTVVLKGSGVALATVVTVAEAIKRKYKEGRQISKLGVLEAEEIYEPVGAKEGTPNKVVKRTVPFLEIELAIKEGILDEKAMGYQGPLTAEDLEGSASLEAILKGPPKGLGGMKGKGKGGKASRKGGKKGNSSSSSGGGKKEKSTKDKDKEEDSSSNSKKEGKKEEKKESSDTRKKGGKDNSASKKKEETSKKETKKEEKKEEKEGTESTSTKKKGKGKGAKKNSSKPKEEPASAAVAA